MPKISLKLEPDHPNEGANCMWVYVGDFRKITGYNSKTSTVASVVNLVRSQVYDSQHPCLFAALLPWCSSLRGFVSRWRLSITGAVCSLHEFMCRAYVNPLSGVV